MEQLKELWDKLGEALFDKLYEQQAKVARLNEQVGYLDDENSRLKDKNKKLANLLRDAASHLDDNNSW